MSGHVSSTCTVEKDGVSYSKVCAYRLKTFEGEVELLYSREL